MAIKRFLKIIKYLMGILFLLVYLSEIIELKTYVEPFDNQVKIAIILALFNIILASIFFFYKTSIKLFFIFLTFIIIYNTVYNDMPTTRTYQEEDLCLEFGICSDGTSIRIDNKVIQINKETCLEHNRIWDNKRNVCKIREYIKK